MSKQHQDTANELYSISSALESAICLKRDPSADDLVWSLIAWAQGTAEETADSLMREQPSPINQDNRLTVRVKVGIEEVTPSRLGALIEQLGNALEKTDLDPVERTQYNALLDALRIETGICQEVAA
ncbi:hypothetical protein [Aeromonas hydrophila]|uniref:hypothetical protein n=1 Tax=Aeromonas hydrophila TaxID=644 RepID=UPI000665BFF7|nr:hypothetical protein [Aeromonas hydrophila]